MIVYVNNVEIEGMLFFTTMVFNVECLIEITYSDFLLPVFVQE